jgi:Trk K+ transport system NAD-binding subunit
VRELRELRNLRPRDFRPRELTRRQRLVAVYAVGLVTLVGAFTVLYNLGMARLEGDPQSMFRSLNTVIETMTTTGYGADAPWATPLMNVFVATMQFSGVLIGFITLRVLVIPLFERAPLNLDDRLSVKDGHVVVAEYRHDTEVLLDELEELDVGYVLIESDEEEAKRLSDAGYQAINGDPEDPADLERAGIGKAATLITDADERTASVVLSALEANPGLRVISFTPSTRRKAALTAIGVDRAVSPGALIGRRLAEKATTPLATEATNGETVVVREVLVRRDSPLGGVRIRDSPLATHPEVTLVAGWFDGELRLSPAPDERLRSNTVLVVAGPEGAIEELAGEVAGVRRPRWAARDRVVVAGFGEGGSAAVEALPEGTEVTTIDQSAELDPDVVGDATEPETLDAARVGEAAAVVVTVDDDATALLTVAMARSLAPDAEILVRVTDAEKATPAFRAGGDYVLSVQRVCARLVAAEVHGERVMDPVSQIRLVRVEAEPFVGETLGELRAGERRWTVVGLTREGQVHTEAGVVVEDGDEVFVAGGDDAIAEFERTTDEH